jgi:hypothetical protein
MSYPVCPTLPISMAKGLHKSPMFNTVFQKVATSRGNSSASLTPFATWSFEWDMDSVQGNEASASSTIAQFLGLHMACQGRAGLFLFTDGQDNTVAYANSGMLDVTAASATPMASTGNAVSTKFQLARSMAGIAWDVIQNVTVTGVKVNGSLKTVTTDYAVSSTGVVTFVSAPANAATLTWTGTYQYLCRFDADTVDSIRTFTTNSGTDLWDVNGIKFASEFV